MQASVPAPGEADAAASDAWRGGWGERLLDWLYPVRCCHCERGISFAAERHLCPACRGQMRLLGEADSCRRCGAALGPHVRPGRDCPECRTREHRFTRALAASVYEGPARSLVHALKFGDLRGTAHPLGRILAERVAAAAWRGALEVVTAVPLHPVRRRERGYNQSALIGRVAAGALGLPFRDGMIRRVRSTRPQTEFGREERLRNPRGAFAPRGPDLGARACLLVDDVMTTGATVSACAEALRAGGVERVYVAVFGR